MEENDLKKFTNRDGSIFLLTVAVMSVLFILGFALTFFTGSEDWASSMNYESEVAFNLAESAVEEFVARLKNSLNHDDSNNQLYKVLRDHKTDVSKEIPLEDSQVARLTAYTRETARQIYGIQFGRGLVHSKYFKVNAKIKLKHINAVEAKSGDKVLYKLKKDLKEKQGELEVIAEVTYKGHTAKVSLKFLVRVVKTFIPPYNYFTLYVKDGSVYGGSHFNTSPSSFSQKKNLRLDNGWNSIKKNFNPTVTPSDWENMLAQVGNKAPTPPGRVYLGQDPNSVAQAGPAVMIRSTNGTKVLDPGQSYNSNKSVLSQMNGQENMFLRFDVPWMGMKKYSKEFMKLQGQQKTKGGLIFSGWNNDDKIRLFNVGAGEELLISVTGGVPSFINCFQTYAVHTGKLISQTPGGIRSNEGMMKYRLMPELDKSGLDVFGTAAPSGAAKPEGRAHFENLSPTLVYGPAMRQYFRGVQVHPKGGQPIELPFIAKNSPLLQMIPGIKESTTLTATQARDLFQLAGLPENFNQKLFNNWEKLPKQLRKLKNYTEFMSDSGVESYNQGLGHFLQRLRGKQSEYDGPLKGYMGGILESFPYPYPTGVPKGMETAITQAPMREFFEGSLWEGLPDRFSTYLLDFYFIPRSTEDFFRGRTTVAMGGNTYDRFDFKYVNNVKSYLSGAKNQTLELNGILALNDSEPLGLRNLKFRGKGIIYSSPMMGGGKVVIDGDLVGVGTPLEDGAFASSIGRHMLTIVAPQIVIKTKNAQSGRCYVEANLISVSEPLLVIGKEGDPPVTIKGTVVTPFLNLEEHFQPVGEHIIVYNPLNGIWRNMMPQLMNSMYVAKIVTGGVGKFDWKYEREH